MRKLFLFIAAALVSTTMWATDPQDTYYKFTATASAGATIAPVSGDGGNITLGSNSAATVVASTASYMGTSYTHAANVNNADNKCFSLNISASEANPAHVFVVMSATSNRTLSLKYGGSAIDQCGARGETTSPALTEFKTTNSGSHIVYCSGSATVYAVHVVYEKNDLWQSIKSASNVTLNKDKTLADDIAALYFFRMQNLKFDNNGVIVFPGAVSNGMMNSINFKAQKNGQVTINYANPASSNRTLTVTEFTRPTTAGTSIVSKSITKGTKDYADETFNVTAGTEYVISFGGDATIKSVNFMAGNTLQYNANGGSGTMENTLGTGTVTLRANTYTKSGCTFQGWATSQANANAGTVAYADEATDYNLSANATLYAVWKLNTPSLSCLNNVVTIDVPGGSTVYYTTTTDGTEPATPTSSSTAYNPASKPTISTNTKFAAIAILANHISSTIATADFKFVTPAYTVGIVVNPDHDGYGSVDVSSVSDLVSGTAISVSANKVLTIGTTDITATATSATDEYTFAFNNWTQSDGTALPATVTADFDIYANFTRTPKNYTLSWNANGGNDLDGEYTSGTVAFGATITKPNTPTRDGYAFIGWAESADGAVVNVPATMPAANKTYYAKWAQCEVSDCGNASIEYVIKVGSSGTQQTDGSDFITSATPSNSTALGASTTIGLSTITISDATMKTAAATSLCFDSKPNMTGKIGMYKGTEYNSSNYLQFTFTVKEGYTFTPCDIQFVVQPVSNATSFRWEVTDGTTVYGYGTKASVPTGSNGGASVLTGLTDATKMSAGTYYIRLYPYCNNDNNTFRLGTDVVLNGTTASTDPTAIDNTEEEVKAVKFFKDGQLFIEKNGHVYNVFGACVK